MWDEGRETGHHNEQQKNTQVSNDTKKPKKAPQSSSESFLTGPTFLRTLSKTEKHDRKPSQNIQDQSAIPSSASPELLATVSRVVNFVFPLLSSSYSFYCQLCLSGRWCLRLPATAGYFSKPIIARDVKGVSFQRTIVVLLLLLRIIKDSVKIETFIVNKAKQCARKAGHRHR